MIVILFCSITPIIHVAVAVADRMKLTVLRLLLKRILLLLLIQTTMLIMLIMLISLLTMLKTEPAEAELANKKPNRTEPFDPCD